MPELVLGIPKEQLVASFGVPRSRGVGLPLGAPRTLRAGSDIDLHIEFLPDAQPSMIDLGRMRDELCAILGRQADLKMPEFLSPAIRARVQPQARLQQSV